MHTAMRNYTSAAAAGTPCNPVAARTARRIAVAVNSTASTANASTFAPRSPVNNAKTVSPSSRYARD